MSHFTSIKTQMVERQFLIQALRDLGYEPQEGKVQVRGYLGDRAVVDIKIATKNPDFDIGFRKLNGVYECVADWYGLKDIDQAKFIHSVTQRYAYHAARAKLQEQGYTLTSEETKDGRIHLVLRRMA